ncbi:hypothetical protein M0R72_10300 [Candidatus Pacearchaeota archaeon]|jgi:hypothetical protein|nr:hypothetical protein [Candidatus Pacearchaeota archaeon]
MLLEIIILVRESASDPPVEKTVAINPCSIARVEESEEEGIVNWWADGSTAPYRTRATVEEFASVINGECFTDEKNETDES